VISLLRGLISARTAANVLLGVLTLLAVFHVLVALGILPAALVWGGRATASPLDPVLLETISLVVTLLFALIVVAHVGYLRSPGLRAAARYGIWLVFAYFTFNIIGNAASLSSLESLIFTPVSFVLAILALRLALER
jgi:uncharacterized protein YacL